MGPTSYISPPVKSPTIGMLLAVVFAVCLPAADRNLPPGRSTQRRSLRPEAIDHVNNHLYVPGDGSHRPAAGWPLILVLHGSEQRGDDPAVLQDLAVLSFAQEVEAFPFVAVVPQCPRGSTWSPRILKRVLDAVEDMVLVDRDRVYLTGFSMGGYGTWKTAAALSSIFAAIAPLCGMSDLDDTRRLAAVPVWAFHGALDENVPPSESRKMVDALRRAGGDARLTVYPHLAHDCWTSTYRDSRLYLWFLAHSLHKGSRIRTSTLLKESLVER